MHGGRTLVRVRGTLIGALVAACGLLGACGHSSGSTAPLVKRHDGPGGAPSSATSAADAGPTDLVSAVSGGGDEGPAGLKFQVGARPVAGHPVVITLRLVANQALDHLEARFLPDEGLEVTQGGEFDPQGHMDAGTAVDHDLTLTPDHDGIYTVLATVTTGSADAAVSRSFVIPIVVGAAVAVRPK
ncbi:MAG: hypothetical protein WA825_10635 [Steroidobacteraceae bacterium]